MRLSRKQKIWLNYVLGSLLFVFIAVSIYQQVQGQKNLAGQLVLIKQQLQHHTVWVVLASLVLMLCNWGIEALKWQRLASQMGPLSYGQAVKSVVAGVAFTMLTPNRMGEYLGRMLYFKEGSRVRAATLTLVGSLSQLIVTLFAGIVGLAALKWSMAAAPTPHPAFSVLLFNVLMWGTAMLLTIGALFYFNLHWVIAALEKIPRIAKYAYFIHLIGQISHVELLRLLLLSGLRYVVFLLQYLLFFSVFGVEASFAQLLAGTAVMFLMLAAIPTIALAELGIRGKASLFIFGFFSSNVLGILAATAGVWMINIILPAIAGSLLLLGIKLYDKS
ncbi:MAG: hypothetical protein EAY75_13770 [Bacteroidetes bacterium]|nr:MAG: hypothetical protein EAY75_13770 [Bacteroidota bacterium]